MENLLCAVLDALAEPEVSYIGLAYSRTIGINAGEGGRVKTSAHHTFTQPMFKCNVDQLVKLQLS